MHTQTIPDGSYHAALERTDPELYQLPEPGSAGEAAMVEGVRRLFTNYNADDLAANLSNVYADEFYFRDAFRELSTIDELEHYLLEGLKPLNAAEFVFHRTMRSGGDFYFEWTMRLDFKKTPEGTWEESIGMTRMRFDSEGRVIFHQDYWDPTDIVYRRIPIARNLIAYVKKQL